MPNRILSSCSQKYGIYIRVQRQLQPLRWLPNGKRQTVHQSFARVFLEPKKYVVSRERAIVCANKADFEDSEVDFSFAVRQPKKQEQSLKSVFSGSVANTPFPLPLKWKERIYQWVSSDQRRLRKYYEKVEKINALEPSMMRLTDEELQGKTSEFRLRLNSNESMDDILCEAFAVVRETARRVLNMRHYDCQLVGGMVLHEGRIAEMETGEGKTLVATLPIYLNVCGGHQVHVVTVNEYLADRDAKWMGTIYSFLGLTVTSVKEAMSIAEKQAAYKNDIVYLTASKLCFDYLNDWSASDVNQIVLQKLDFAIIDEVDCILIDESRNPMVISSSSTQLSNKIKTSAEIIYEIMEEKKYGLVNTLANQLRELDLLAKRGISQNVSATDRVLVHDSVRLLIRIITETNFLSVEHAPEQLLRELVFFSKLEDLKYPETFAYGLGVLLQFHQVLTKMTLYKIDTRAKRVSLTEFGADLLISSLVSRGEEVEGAKGIALWEGGKDSNSWGPYLINAIKVYEFFRLGQEYIIVDGNIIIVDESTGRTRQRSRWQDLLHQAVEAKEQVYQDLEIQTESRNMTKPIEIHAEDETTASITFQIFFRYYKKLAGMSGTALSEAKEFQEIFRLSVFHVPSHYPCQRIDHKPIIFYDPAGKLRHIICRLADCHEVRPVLIGTNSVEESELLMKNLKIIWKTTDNRVLWDGANRYKNGKLLMLNARPEVVKHESKIIAQAGLPGMVTIATRMAGRGTDILLGGNPKGLVENALYSSILKRCIPDLQLEQSVSYPEFDLSIDGSKKVPPSLSGLVMNALARGTASEETIMTDESVDALLSRVMNLAQELRSDVYIQLQTSENSIELSELDFERHIRSAIARTWASKEQEIEKETPFIQAMVKCALYAWLWFDQKCESYAATVRAAGGLLVIGMSMSESKRIENQLRGRAGRQGDPGESIMLADATDRMLILWKFEAVRKAFEKSSVAPTDRVVGTVAEYILNTTRTGLENAYRQARTQIANYDEVMEEFRQQCYFLKGILLNGTDEERNQLLYTWIQDLADTLVNSYADVNQHPKNWRLWESSEMDSLEELIDRLFNPPKNTYLCPTYNMKQKQLPIIQELVNSGVESEELVNEVIEDECQVPFVRVIPFTPGMKKDLTYALYHKNEPKESPSMHFLNGRCPLNLKTRHALALHRKLIKQRKLEKQLTSVGRFTEQVDLLQEYIGELMIMLFEERKRQLLDDFSREEGFVKLDVQTKLISNQKLIMLSLLDTVWADFLKFCAKLKTTTTITSLRGSPLEEFSVEAHKEFASMLTMYRHTVASNVIVPRLQVTTHSDLRIWLDLLDSVGSEEEETEQLASTESEENDRLEDTKVVFTEAPEDALDSSEHSKPTNY